MQVSLNCADITTEMSLHVYSLPPLYLVFV